LSGFGFGATARIQKKKRVGKQGGEKAIGTGSCGGRLGRSRGAGGDRSDRLGRGAT